MVFVVFLIVIGKYVQEIGAQESCRARDQEVFAREFFEKRRILRHDVLGIFFDGTAEDHLSLLSMFD